MQYSETKKQRKPSRAPVVVGESTFGVNSVNMNVMGTRVPLAKLDADVVTVALMLVPNCSAAMRSAIAE